MVAVTGLEYAYTHAPPALKSLVTSLWLLTIAGGNYFLAIMNGSIAQGGFFAQFQGASYYWFFVGLMAVNVSLFALLAARLPQKTYVGLQPLPLEPLAE
jgi:POT family proton-dependent oligopeptide transporter